MPIRMTTKTKNESSIPFQVSMLIEKILDQSENAHTREIYRQRLEDIQTTIDKALKLYSAMEINQKRS